MVEHLPNDRRSRAFSPDGQKTVVRKGLDELWLYTLSGKKALLGNGFWVRGADRVSGQLYTPVFWLDNVSFLTQRGNGKIVFVNTGTKKIRPFIDIPIDTPALSSPGIYKNPVGQIIYSFSGEEFYGSFIIDLKNKTYTPYKWFELGNDFSGENERDIEYGHIIRYKGEEIGRFWCSVWGARTTKNYIVFKYGKVGSNLGYPDGLKVWSSESREWTTINEGWSWDIIGWIEE